ncbi:MAG: CDP-alcohol phosphatidyltransferase family protein [bacterium]|nr:CDP-alcohol phosphatidyltransferase family protein [bacterium]
MLKELLLLPNLLSLSRIFLAPIIIYYVALQDNRAALIALVLMTIAGLTDGLDGYFARRFKQITKLGLMIDPLADKVMAAILIVGLIIYRDFPLWLAGLVIGRDLIILAASAVMLKGRDVVIPSSEIGKYAFGTLAVLLGSHICRFEYGIEAMTIATTVLLSATFFVYGRFFLILKATGKLPERRELAAVRYARLTALGLYTVYFFYRFFQHLPSLLESGS